MIIRFNDLQLHNFLSYEDATINLLSKGFCLVSGKNNYRKDSALSNGSGKSTIWSAICFALTGETITGIKNNLKNIYTADTATESYVKLSVLVDKDEYIITRYIEPKSDLKINKNGIDISGKGIRESEKILAENLPDLTKDLISSTILLGQGLPNRFSSFSPSGRKDLLEKLTKSDFMIDDIKNRINDRLDTLSKQQRAYEDSILVNNTQLSSDTTTLNTYLTTFNAFTKRDFKTLISTSETVISTLQQNANLLDSECKQLDTDIEMLNSSILAMTEEKAKVNDEELKNYSAIFNQFSTEKAVAQTTKAHIEQEIKKLKDVKDICPTCGQKLPGVLKPDTAEQEAQLKNIIEKINEYDEKLKEIAEKHQNYLLEIDEHFKDLQTSQDKLRDLKNSLRIKKDEFNKLASQINTEKVNLEKLIFDKDNEEKNYNSLKNTIEALEQSIKTITDSIKITTLAKIDNEEHIAVIKKIDTLVKRDFRGFLLSNIIEYLNQKAKEYSQIVFGTDELNIYLDGNALDISYCGKIYEMLSGGEKQRVDIITQFAIRELLQAYFNYSSNILVLDEITDNLDRVATNKIFDLITEKLKDVESVFIISHHADELGIPVDSEIQVIKNTTGISEVKEIK